MDYFNKLVYVDVDKKKHEIRKMKLGRVVLEIPPGF